MDWEEVEKVVYFWEKLDLIKFRSNYDEKGLEIETIREDCQKNRKNLSTITKDFRKLGDPEKLKKFGSLVRSYQQEINNLTERGRKSEKNFLEILNYLREVRDPTPVLKKVIVSFLKLFLTSDNNNEQENEKKYEVNKLVKDNEEMNSKLEQYKKEFQEIKNQEVTIRHLENQLQFLVDEQKKKEELASDAGDPSSQNAQDGEGDAGENGGEEDDGEEIEVQKFDVTSLLANFQDQIDGLKDKNYELEKMVEHHKGLYSQTETKLRSLSMELSRSQQSHQQELELVRGDLDKYQMEENLHNQEREKLREYQKQEQHYLQLEREVKERESQIHALTKKLARAEATIREGEANFNELASQSKLKDKKILDLEKELETRPNNEEFEETKKRLEMMEKIEFGDLSVVKNDDEEKFIDEHHNEATDEEKGGFGSSSKKPPSIEVLLNRKIRKLEHAFTNLKNELSEKVLECAKHEMDVGGLSQKVQTQASLIEKLENDLMNIQSAEMESEHMSEALVIEDDHQSSSIVDQSSSASFFTSAGSGSNTMLNAVVQQRNRLKKQTESLKDVISQYKEKMNISKVEIQRLNRDNLKMYEKIRYIESYSGNNATPESPTSPVRTYRDKGGDTIVSMNREHTHQKNKSNEGETRYRKMYEEKLNASLVESPFNQFSKKEKSEQFKKLAFAERLTLITTGKMLRHKSGRMFLFIYTFSLHLLVFFMCYYVVRRC